MFYEIDKDRHIDIAEIDPTESVFTELGLHPVQYEPAIQVIDTFYYAGSEAYPVTGSMDGIPRVTRGDEHRKSASHYLSWGEVELATDMPGVVLTLVQKRLLLVHKAWLGMVLKEVPHPKARNLRTLEVQKDPRAMLKMNYGFYARLAGFD